MSLEELGGVGFALILVFLLFFAVLGFLVPWFVWRTSVYTQETRDLVRDVKKILRENQLESRNPFKQSKTVTPKTGGGGEGSFQHAPVPRPPPPRPREQGAEEDFPRREKEERSRKKGTAHRRRREPGGPSGIPEYGDGDPRPGTNFNTDEDIKKGRKRYDGN